MSTHFVFKMGFAKGLGVRENVLSRVGPMRPRVYNFTRVGKEVKMRCVIYFGEDRGNLVVRSNGNDPRLNEPDLDGGLCGIKW